METKKEKLPKIDENMHHRARVVARKREVFKVQNDVENESLMQCVCEQMEGKKNERFNYHSENLCHWTDDRYMGEWGKARQKRKAYLKKINRIAWAVVIGIVGVGLLYVLIINLFNI